MSDQSPKRTSIVASLIVAAVVLGLGFIVVGNIRESSRRVETNNCLKATALAIHTYHDNFNRLPNAYGRSDNSSPEASMWVHLLPFVGQKEAYSNSRVDAVVPAFLAPSDRYNTTRGGVISFAGNLRIFANKSLANVNSPGTALAVRGGTMLSGLKLQSIADGVTNTLMLTTRYGTCGGETTWYAADVTGDNSLAPVPGPGVGGFMGAGEHSTPPTKFYTPDTAMFQIRPTEVACIPQAGLFGHSFGTEGLSIALCDTSVRNISPTMKPRCFGSVLCPGDGGDGINCDWDE